VLKVRLRAAFASLLLSPEPASFDDLLLELFHQPICWLGGQEMHVPIRITDAGALVVARQASEIVDRAELCKVCDLGVRSWR
jgi:hypothetical protein